MTTAENITVYAIGVGNNADISELALSATGNRSNYDRVLTSSQFSDLEVQLSNLTRAISSVSAEGLYIHNKKSHESWHGLQSILPLFSTAHFPNINKLFNFKMGGVTYLRLNAYSFNFSFVIILCNYDGSGGGAVDLTLENAQLGISGHYSQVR